MLADQQPRLQADPFSARGCRVLPPCLCRPTLFYGGFALLPWLWLTNVWLFWPEFRQGSDPEIQKCGPSPCHRPPPSYAPSQVATGVKNGRG